MRDQKDGYRNGNATVFDEVPSFGVFTQSDVNIDKSKKIFGDSGVVVSEGYYGIQTITHCCLESHGSVAQWTGPDTLKTYSSTQNVSGIPGELGEALRQAKIDIKDTNIENICQYVGGGFGSKFGADRWGVENARLSKLAGKPVKFLLEKDIDLEVAGAGLPASPKSKWRPRKTGRSWPGNRNPGGQAARRARACRRFPMS